MGQTVLTSQGTLTLPAEVRRKYNLLPGDVLTVEDNDGIRIVKSTSFSELRKKNNVHSGALHGYKQGDGWAAHVMEKYGKNKK